MSTESITVELDLDQLARQIDRIAQQSLDPDAAERLADIAHKLIGELRAREAWLMSTYTLIGRCDMAFEMIAEAKLLGPAKKTAKQLRSEIKKASQG